MSKSQREKGKRGELEAVAALRSIYPQAARKVTNHAGQENGVDLINTGGLRVQVKCRKTYAALSALDEVKDATGRAVVLTKAYRREWRVIMRLDDLLDILHDVGEAFDA